MIWIFARPAPRVLKIFENKDEEVFYATAKVPALLHACQESRRIANKWYELSFPWNPYKPQYSRVYFDCSSDFVYVPRHNREDKSNPTRLDANPCALSGTKPIKIMNVIQEVPVWGQRFFDLSLWLPSAEKALLVLQGEGMLEGSAELSEFALTADPFPWQGTRTFQQVYIAASEERRPGNMVLGWNLTSIQRARFGAIGKDG